MLVDDLLKYLNKNKWYDKINIGHVDNFLEFRTVRAGAYSGWRSKPSDRETETFNQRTTEGLKWTIEFIIPYTLLTDVLIVTQR